MGKWIFPWDKNHYSNRKQERVFGMNTVILIGNLGRDPETKSFDSGAMLAEFSLATQDSRKNGDTWEKVTDWHNIKVFGKQAENAAKYLGKGSKCAVTGKLKVDTWEKEGVKKYKTYVLADRIEFLDSRQEQETTKDNPSLTERFESGDIPF